MDDVATAAGAVAAAVQLASALDARLAAVFLENVDLMRAAELTFLRETGGVSGSVRPMAGEVVLRTLRTHAAQVRATVAAAAQASGLAWQFEVVRERRLAVLRSAREALDLLVLAQARAHATGRASPGRPASDAAPVAVLVPDARDTEGAFAAAVALAAGFHAPLLLLVHPRGPGEAHVRELASRAAGEAHLRTACVTLQHWSMRTVATALRQHDARLLVCTEDDLREDAERLDALLSHVTCPVVVV